MDELDDISTTTIINKTKAHFARFGVPCICHRENGPQFTSQEYAEFAAHYRFKHTTSSPYHSQRNGKAEAAVKVSESILKKSDDLQTALLNHRNTPPKGRRTRTTLPTPDHLLEPTTIHTDTVIEEIKTTRSNSKTYYDKSARNAMIQYTLANLFTHNPHLANMDNRGHMAASLSNATHDHTQSRRPTAA